MRGSDRDMFWAVHITTNEVGEVEAGFPSETQLIAFLNDLLPGRFGAIGY